MFGGVHEDDSSGWDSVYVLSLPSFIWTVVNLLDHEDMTREGHSCAIVGRSQFLTWGGVPPDKGPERYGSKDPFPQGLKIFDLDTLNWRDEYDPDAPPYTPHSKLFAA